MPRNIRWDESVKENALNLVEALLKQADNEFDDLELKAAVHVQWTENKLRVTGKEKQKRRNREQIVEVGTRKEHLVKLVNEAGKSLNLPQRKKESGSSQQERELEEVQTLLDCLRELGVFEEEKNTRKNQGYWKFTLTLRHQTATREENLEVVRQKWQEHPKTNSLVTSSTTPILETENSIDWRDVCRTSLEKQKHLTTNRLMSAKQMLFDINQICVDLALVERKQPDKRSGDDNPARSQLYKPDYEETQKLEYKDFLATVLKASPSNKIAVIGEPGAGKTTLLQRIAFWILDNTNGLPIWIPLGNLPTDAPKLKDYLLHNWLEDAILNVTPKIRAEFEELLTAGRLWLLLDGVDEMVANSGSPLSFIDKWIPAWCQQLSVVLTCRLNVWEANPHALNNFQTYRTLEFSQEKVNEFIEACFQESNPALGTQLQQALNQPGKERIKDLIRNPLRLMLLCSTWHLREGKLPDTKAELYQQFVEEVYRWKEDEFSTTPEERKQLNAKLKELALAAIDKEENRFCLRHKFVEGVLGERDGSVFQLALNIGWLNRVGVDAKNPNPNQPVYAFFHPTFQEYFAALAIADWDFFLPRAHDKRNPKPVSDRYRIFEPQWKEVILLWLGCEEVANEQKDTFIKTLVEFEDGCGNFYWYRTLFAAATGISEFGSCDGANELVTALVKLDFGYLNVEEQRWMTFIVPVANGARAALQETDKGKAIAVLAELLSTSPPEFICEQVAKRLGQIGKNNSAAIETLINLIHTAKDKHRYLQAVISLEQINSGHPLAIEALARLAQTDEDQHTQLQAAESLGETDRGKPVAIEVLARLAQTAEDEIIRWVASKKLWHIAPNNPVAIEVLAKLAQTGQTENTQWLAAVSLGEINPADSIGIKVRMKLAGTAEDENVRWQAAVSLGQIKPSDPINIEALIKLLQTSKNQSLLWLAAKGLWKFGKDNLSAIKALLGLTQTAENDYIRWLAAQSLRGIVHNYGLKLAVSALKDGLKDTVYKNDCDRYNDCYGVIWHCAQNMTYPAFYQAWHQQEGVGKTTTSDSQSLNQADLAQSLQNAIANNPQLSQTLHLICIDGSQFIDPDNPATEIYDQMLDQNCPECDSVPETMPALKLYWNSLKRNSDKRVVLVFYASSTDTTPDEGTTLSCPYSSAFLTDLSKFGREICAIAEQPFNHIPLKFFAPSQAIEDIVQWIRAIVLEN